MNVPRYIFAQESELTLLKFLKISQEQKHHNENFNLEAHTFWSQLCPSDPELLQHSNIESISVPEGIDLCSGRSLTPKIVPSEEEDEDQISSITDIAFVIQETLQTRNTLDDSCKECLKNNSSTLNVLFELLNNLLTNEESVFLGETLKDMDDDSLINAFVNFLLFSRMKKEYCVKLSEVLNEFSLFYFPLFEKEWSLILKTLAPTEVIIVVEYLKHLNSTIKSKLARHFILSLPKLDENCLKIIETLLNNEVDFEVISKLVELLSNIAEIHKTDKNFGKLLINIMEILGPHLVQLEEPLRHIISGHKSVWKSKLQTKFQTKYEDTMLFSQSFRD